MNRGRVLGVFLIALTLAGGLSCSLFDTRDPVTPRKTQQFPCLTLTTPNNVFVNIQQAYFVPSGLACYVTVLADSLSPTSIGFRFHPDPADSTEQFLYWGKTVEERVAENLANSIVPESTELRLKLPYESITTQPDLEIRRYAYEIDFKDKNGAIPDRFFQGLAEIRVEKGIGGQWQITDWVDRRDPGGTTTRTWGYLRGSYRIGF